LSSDLLYSILGLFPDLTDSTSTVLLRYCSDGGWAGVDTVRMAPLHTAADRD
jgi:hypothetical protein